MKAPIILAAILCLSGCASTQQRAVEQEQTRLNADLQAADAQTQAECWPIPVYVERAKCINSKLEGVVKSHGASDLDLILVLDAHRLKYAQMVDDHQMTPVDAQLEMAKRFSELQSQSMERAQAQQAVNAQQQAANAATSAADAQQIESAALLFGAFNAPVPAYQIPASTQTHCRPDYNGGVNCTSY